MSPLWLVGVPLAGAAIAALLGRCRRLSAMIGLVTLAACLLLRRSIPSQSAIVLFRQSWVLNASVSSLLTYSYVTAAILLAIAALDHHCETFVATMLTCLSALSAGLLLRSTWLSLVVLAAAMLLPTLGSSQASPSSVRGATRYLIWVTLPIPFLLAIPALLEQVSVHPQELEWFGRYAWLLVPAALLWLNLFPLDAAMSLWANDAAPLMPAFIWLVQQVVVLHMLMAFWDNNPLLWTPPVALLVRAFALLTALLAGVVATIQLSLPAVLGSAAMATFGLAVLGIVSGTEDGLVASGIILAGRSAAILVACAALQAAHFRPQGEVRPQSVGSRVAALVPVAVVCVAVAAMVLLPLAALPKIDTSALSVLSAFESRLPQLWTISTVGVLIGMGRTSWLLWRTRPAGSTRGYGLLAVLLICLLLLVLLLLLNPQALARIAAYILPA